MVYAGVDDWNGINNKYSSEPIKCNASNASNGTYVQIQFTIWTFIGVLENCSNCKVIYHHNAFLWHGKWVRK